MIRKDANGTDGGGRREDILLTYSPSFTSSSLLFFSFSPSFFIFFVTLFSFLKILQNFKRNKHMEELFCGVLKRVCKNVKCNV